MIDQINPIQYELYIESLKKSNSVLFRIIFLKRYRIIRYLLFITIIFFNEIANMLDSYLYEPNGGFVTPLYILEFISCLIVMMGFIIFNLYVALPKLFLKGKYGLYIISNCLAVTLFELINLLSLISIILTLFITTL